MAVNGTLKHLPMLRNAVLQCVADLIEQQGWSARGSRPQLCITQAMAAVTGHDDATELGSIPDQVSNEAFRAILRQIGGEYLGAIFDWEGEEGRTQEEVVAMLRATATWH
ncbi:DUF6197 family protein [Streptomyces collinus]|uniref:DUF6197 family protein n=1 Tax=Streptomyces collinus TaxID=42684 RepID=UPI003809E3CC